MLSGCGVNYNIYFANVTEYPVIPDTYTAKMVQVDTSGLEVNLADIDRRVDEVEQCLTKRFPDGQLSNRIIVDAHCRAPSFLPAVNRSELTIKIAPDWRNGCSGQQVFPCGVDPKYCIAKDITPTAECPCACRSAIQDDTTIVVTPNLYLLKGDLLRIITGCNFPWVPGLQECFSD